jgi:RHS repeat-associated protein
MKKQPFLLARLSYGALLVLFLLLPGAALSKTIGGNPPYCGCPCACSCACVNPNVPQSSSAGSSLSLTEGNLSEPISASTTQSSFGRTLDFSLTYNSYDADNSRAQLDTVMGYGWTHSFNTFLFSQLGAMFRYDGAGRVTRYKLGPGGTFIAAAGYFETLVKNPDGSFTLTKKDQTTYKFATTPGTPFLVGGPVLRLTTITDRNGNITTFTYTSGNLTSVKDTYGRTVTFAYNTQNKLTSSTDPAARVTTFQYDPTGHMLTKITDPNGNTIQYTYNAFYQLTRKIDKSGRTFSYSYVNSAPVAVNDASGASRATLSNSNNWATDSTQLALFQLRVYLPSTVVDTDGRGNLWKYQYDSNGYPTQTIAPDGATTTYTYDPATLQLATLTDANGHTTSYQYDAQGNRTKVTDALGHVTTYTYEPVFNMVTSTTDPRGRVTLYTYDAHGNRIQEQDPLGQIRTWTYDAHGNVLTETDKNGHATTYQYDAFGDRTKIIDPLGNVTSITYDAVGNTLSRTDPNGHTTSYQYDGLNRLTVETDATGHTTQTIYDGEGNRIQVIDRDGHSTSYQYDLRQRLIKTTDALNQTETYAYDGDDNRLSLTDRNGHTTAYQYDLQDRLITVTDALGDVSSMTYDPVGNLVTQTDANIHVTSFNYDPLNRRITLTDALSHLTQYQYDTGTVSGCPSCGATPGSSLITGQTDANGKVTYFKYDALDRQILVVRKVGSTADTITPSDAVTTYTYDPIGNHLSMTEPDGNTTTYQYDSDNRRTKVTNAAGDVTSLTYDGVGNVITTTAPNLNVTTDSYDVLNRLTQVTDSVGLVTRYTYDPVGNVLSQSDGNGNTTAYAYDALNRLTTTTDPLGKTTLSQYDPVGNVLKTTDRNGNVSTYTYDAINRRISATDALGHTTQSQYDAVGNLLMLTDANGHQTQYAYDAIDRRIKETYADGKTRTFTYDGVGNILTRTDQIGQTTTYTYNDLYFLLSRSYPSAINDSYTYDLSGRMLSGQRGSWIVTFTYDGANRVTNTVQNGHAIAYTYNIPGRIRTLTYPGSRVINEHTDPRARLDHIDDAASPPPIVQYNYDLANRAAARTYRNGTTTAYSYNTNDWVVNLQHSHGATPIAGFAYAYDNEGNKQFEQKLQDTTHSEAYQYDNVNRLINYKVGTLVGSTVPVPSTQTAYNLDPVGNWNSKTTNAVVQNRTHNAVNELTQIDAAILTYDADGNLQTDPAFSYAYDEENRLTKVTRTSDSAVVGQYQYDALSRRVQKIADPAGPPVTTVYFYDDARVIEEQSTLGVTQATYVYGNYVDETLTMDRGGQTYYYHQNALWSVEAVTDSAANPVERYSYDAYGLVTVTTGAGAPVPPNAWGTPHSAIANPWLFTSRQLDEETGLYYYRARYYDANKGRFLQRNPRGYVDGMNLYEYAGSRPTYYTDPYGLDNCCVDNIELVKKDKFKGGKSLNDYFLDLVPAAGDPYWGKKSDTAGPFDSTTHYGFKVQIVCKVTGNPDLCKLSQFVQVTESNYPGEAVNAAPYDDIAASKRDPSKPPFRQSFESNGSKFLSFADPPGYAKVKTFKAVNKFTSCCISACVNCKNERCCVDWTWTIQVKDDKEVKNEVDVTKNECTGAKKK